MSEQEDAKRWPLWSEKAIKGDVVRVAVYQNATLAKLANAVAAILNDDKDKARKQLEAYLKEDQELNRIINETGGE